APVELARHLGATVATTCSGRNTELVRTLGAETVVDYTTTRFEEALEPQDVVLECMGAASRARALKVLKRGGRLTSINSDMVPRAKRYGPYLATLLSGVALVRMMVAHRLFWGVRSWPVVRVPSGTDLAAIGTLLEQGVIRPVIDQTFTLDAIVEAHRASEQGRTRGKIVIAVRP
ncbi:MAG: zinc-binding dehydrogenase, partial [Myxococcota bacterium]